MEFRKKQLAASIAEETRDTVEIKAREFAKKDGYREDLDKRPGQIQVGGPKALKRANRVARIRDKVGPYGLVASLLSVPFAVAGAAVATPFLLAAPLLIAGFSVRESYPDYAKRDVGHLRYGQQGEIQSFDIGNGIKNASLKKDGEAKIYGLREGHELDHTVVFKGDDIEVTTRLPLKDEKFTQLPTHSKESFKNRLFEVKLEANGKMPEPAKLSEDEAKNVVLADLIMDVVGKAVGGLKVNDQSPSDMDTSENRVVMAPSPTVFTHGVKSGLFGGVAEMDPETGSVTEASGFQGNSSSAYRRSEAGVSARVAPRSLGKSQGRDEFGYRKEGLEETFFLNGYAVVKDGASGTLTAFSA